MASKSPIPSIVKKVRADISDWLWHFVRQGNEMDTLRTILQEKRLKGDTDPATATKVVCLTEAPAVEFLKQSSVLKKARYKRLSNYGFGFTKIWAFDRGGLPVIYQPRRLLEKLLTSLQPTHQEILNSYRFRHVDFDPATGLDYSWQREWRIPGAEVTFAPQDIVVVVPSFAEAEGILYDIEADSDIMDHDPVCFPVRIPKWHFLALDQFKGSASLNDTEIEMCWSQELPPLATGPRLALPPAS